MSYGRLTHSSATKWYLTHFPSRLQPRSLVVCCGGQVHLQPPRARDGRLARVLAPEGAAPVRPQAQLPGLHVVTFRRYLAWHDRWKKGVTDMLCV